MNARNAPVLLAALLIASGPLAADLEAQNCCIEALGLGSRAPAELVWPVAPDTPRIRYLGLLHSERDLGRGNSFFGKLKQLVVGARTDLRAIQRPHDVYTEDGRTIYVSDGGVSKVLAFDGETRRAQVLGEEGPGRLMKPMGIGGDGQGRVYVADQTARRVVVFGPGGEYLRALGGSRVLLNPVDVAVDAARNRVYVVDAYLHQVVVFDTLGAVVDKLGRDEGDLTSKAPQPGAAHGANPGAEGIEEQQDPTRLPGHLALHSVEPRDLTENRGAEVGEFRYPAFVAVGPDGTLYVSDGMNFRVQAFGPDGKHLRTIGQIGDTPGSFARPKGLAVNNEGHLYVVDAAFNNLQIFDAEGRLLLPFGSVGHGPGQLWLPLGLAIDQEDRIYVADRYNNRVQIFEYLPRDPLLAEQAGGR